jgi:hypothetical protein
MAIISVIGHDATRHGPTRLGIALSPFVPQIHDDEVTSPQAEAIAAEKHPSM